MGDLKVCRICLNMDVKMFDMQAYPLESYFSSIVVESKYLCNNLPPYACYECAALVKKFYLFRQKCLRSQALLCRIIDDCGELTPAAIKSIDRQSFLIVTNLTHINIEQENVTNNTNDEERPEFVVEVIKKEDHDDIDIPDNIPDGSSSDDECEDKKVKKKVKNVEVEKFEISKDKKKVKEFELEKVKILVKMDIQEELDGSNIAEITIDAPKLPPKAPKRRTRSAQVKKRSRPQRTGTTVAQKKPKKVIKDDSPCVDNTTDMEDITVVTLSMEQQLEEVNKRKQSSNYLNCPYQCHLCYRGFNNAQTWKHHVTKHSSSIGDIECTICKYRFKTKRNLQRHAQNHGRRYVCKLCPYNSSNITTVKQHQGSHKGVTHKCNYCDEVFTVRTTYVSHMRIKHPSENICGYCGYSFYSKQGLLVHKNMVHRDIVVKDEENKDGPYCADCDVKFISTEAFKRHMVMSVKHTRSTDSIKGCRVCGETFADSEDLRVHHREEHPKRQPKHHRPKAPRSRWPANCKYCSEEISSARAYSQHFRLVHPDKNYPIQKKCVCEICGKRFVCNALLVMHKRTHFGERPYKCSECDKACFTAFDLRVHQQKHSEVRPFPCSVCSKAFKRKEALERHLKIHSGDNLYKCEICGVAFNKSCTRTLHVRTVHTKEPAPPRKRRNKTNK